MSRCRHPAAGAVLVLALSLGQTACGGNGGATRLGAILGTSETRPCPRAVVISDARHIFDLAPGEATADAVRVAGRIALPATLCQFEEDKILVELALPFDAARGPVLKEGGLEFELPYFVAVADRFDTILAKEVFFARMKLGGDQERASVVEKIEQIIPLGPGLDGSHFVIYVGFQLTPEQVEFNRRHRL